jgi:hypothetical protein
VGDEPRREDAPAAGARQHPEYYGAAEQQQRSAQADEAAAAAFSVPTESVLLLANTPAAQPHVQLASASMVEILRDPLLTAPPPPSADPTVAGTDRSDPVLARLLALHPKLIDYSLERVHDMLRRLGDPHRSLPPVVHVAGTNGKGSTVAFLRAMLEAAGLRVHVYTSPHLVRFHERIRLAGRLVDDAALADLLEVCERLGEARDLGVPLAQLALQVFNFGVEGCCVLCALIDLIFQMFELFFL